MIRRTAPSDRWDSIASIVALAILCLCVTEVWQRAEGQTLPTPPTSELAGDPLATLLLEAGVSPTALGFHPVGTWLRYPDPNSIRFKSRLFDTFFSDPGSIYPAIALMARAGEQFLEPSFSDSQGIALFKLAYYTGWDPHISGFRDYNAGMTLQPASASSVVPGSEGDPLTDAIATLWTDAGRTFDYVSFETPAD